MPSLWSQIMCRRSSSGGCECGSVRVATPCAAGTLALTLMCVYTLPLVNHARKLETYVPSKCVALDYSVETYTCMRQVCSGGAGSGAGSTCARVTAVCFACQFNLMMTSAEGIPLLAPSDYVGAYETPAAATAACVAMAATSATGSPLPCWYIPDSASDARFYITLELPATSASIVPVYAFGVIFLLCTATTVACYCCTADPVAERMRSAEAARAREIERYLHANMRAQRWSDYYAEDGSVNPMQGVISVTQRRREQVERTTGPQPVIAPAQSRGDVQYTGNSLMLAQEHARSQDVQSSVTNPVYRRSLAV